MTENIIDVKLVFDEAGDYLLDNGERKEVTVSKDGLAYVLPENSANRTFIAFTKLNKLKESGATELVLQYRPTRTIGPVGSKLPNENLIAYLSPEEQEEYKAIVARAIEARNAAKAQPLTSVEKIEAKIAKLKEQLAELSKLSENN